VTRGPDAHELARFLEAQERCYPRVLEELATGQKTSHWMWFIFPQLRGLGVSSTARRFGLAGLDDARAYLAHPMLGARLRECVRSVLAVEGRSAHQIFGSPDDLKLRSCLTLFAAAAAGGADDQVFRAALTKYYGGEPDPLTVQLLAGG
jgi:uncharacterized protein (DUF1810 family)